jgi:AraC-like DNA-binding protein
MYSEQELGLLRATLRKSRLKTQILSPRELEEVLERAQTESSEVSYSHLTDLSPRTLYQVRGDSGLCYLYLLLPIPHAPSVLLIGPYLSTSPSREEILEIGERNSISPKRRQYLEEYYERLPVLTEGNSSYFLINTFCERMWDSPSFAIVNVNDPYLAPILPQTESETGDAFADLLINMKAMETRYAFENELIEAVSLGQLHREHQLLSAISEEMFEKRIPDSLRNSKNYCIIMNTLLRKAAEKGGVHPVYIDRLSSSFAQQIEGMTTFSENAALMKEMFRSYCRLVRKHTMKRYSPLVQKTVLLIESDLSADLTSSALAKSQSVSLGHLCEVFRKETGKTVSEYVRERRIRYAAHLLATTNLLVQTVALHCGIMDVQYFSKLFKQEMGMTPKEYRASVNEKNQTTGLP